MRHRCLGKTFNNGCCHLLKIKIIIIDDDDVDVFCCLLLLLLWGGGVLIYYNNVINNNNIKLIKKKEEKERKKNIILVAYLFSIICTYYLFLLFRCFVTVESIFILPTTSLRLDPPVFCQVFLQMRLCLKGFVQLSSLFASPY